MINQNIDRKKVIKELQTLAESVLNLKSEHRQKRPIVIEFSGSPKAGKTSCINSLELFLKSTTQDVVLYEKEKIRFAGYGLYFQGAFDTQGWTEQINW